MIPYINMKAFTYLLLLFRLYVMEYIKNGLYPAVSAEWLNMTEKSVDRK